MAININISVGGQELVAKAARQAAANRNKLQEDNIDKQTTKEVAQRQQSSSGGAGSDTSSGISGTRAGGGILGVGGEGVFAGDPAANRVGVKTLGPIAMAHYYFEDNEDGYEDIWIGSGDCTAWLRIQTQDLLQEAEAYDDAGETTVYPTDKSSFYASYIIGLNPPSEWRHEVGNPVLYGSLEYTDEDITEPFEWPPTSSSWNTVRDEGFTCPTTSGNPLWPDINRGGSNPDDVRMSAEFEVPGADRGIWTGLGETYRYWSYDEYDDFCFFPYGSEGVIFTAFQCWNGYRQGYENAGWLSKIEFRVNGAIVPEYDTDGQFFSTLDEHSTFKDKYESYLIKYSSISSFSTQKATYMKACNPFIGDYPLPFVQYPGFRSGQANRIDPLFWHERLFRGRCQLSPRFDDWADCSAPYRRGGIGSTQYCVSQASAPGPPPTGFVNTGFVDSIGFDADDGACIVYTTSGDVDLSVTPGAYFSVDQALAPGQENDPLGAVARNEGSYRAFSSNSGGIGLLYDEELGCPLTTQKPGTEVDEDSGIAGAGLVRVQEASLAHDYFWQILPFSETSAWTPGYWVPESIAGFPAFDPGNFDDGGPFARRTLESATTPYEGDFYGYEATQNYPTPTQDRYAVFTEWFIRDVSDSGNEWNEDFDYYSTGDDFFDLPGVSGAADINWSLSFLNREWELDRGFKTVEILRSVLFDNNQTFPSTIADIDYYGMPGWKLENDLDEQAINTTDWYPQGDTFVSKKVATQQEFNETWRGKYFAFKSSDYIITKDAQGNFVRADNSDKRKGRFYISPNASLPSDPGSSGLQSAIVYNFLRNERANELKP